MAEVFLCQTGQLSAASKRELKRAGVVVVEVEDPSRCQFIRSSTPLSGDDMLWAALSALRQNYRNDPYNVADAHRQKFALNIIEAIEASRLAERPQPEASDA